MKLIVNEVYLRLCTQMLADSGGFGCEHSSDNTTILVLITDMRTHRTHRIHRTYKRNQLTIFVK